MKWQRIPFPFVLAAAAALLLCGCASSYHARDVELKQTMLVNPAILTPGTGDQALYRYKSPDLKVGNYDKMLVDPVLISRSSELDAERRENLQKLANNAYIYLVEQLRKDFRIVTTPEPGAMRLQMAILDVETASPVRNVVTSVVPIGIGFSAISGAATGKQTGVGEITAEVKLTDAMTGTLLGAAVDRRVGGKDVGGMFDSWHNADESMKYWAKKARFNFCVERGGSNCVKP